MTDSTTFEDLLGRYWDLAYLEGKSGISQGDKAGEVLHALKKMAVKPARTLEELYELSREVSAEQPVPVQEPVYLVEDDFGLFRVTTKGDWNFYNVTVPGVKKTLIANTPPAQPQQELVFTYDQVKAHIQAAMMSAAQQEPLTDEVRVKQLNHCMIAVRDWLVGGCNTNNIPEDEITALVAFTDYEIHKENT